MGKHLLALFFCLILAVMIEAVSQYSNQVDSIPSRKHIYTLVDGSRCLCTNEEALEMNKQIKKMATTNGR